MFHDTILCLLALYCAVSSDILEHEDQDNRLEDLCNQDIPEDRSVHVGRECRISQNCKQVDSECVHIRENYCECKMVEDRMIKKWKIKFRNRIRNLCKNNVGHSCSKKSRCQKRYRKQRKICRHPRHVCCTKCKNLDGYECMNTKSCPAGSQKTWYQCKKKSEVCCKLKEVCAIAKLEGNSLDSGSVYFRQLGETSPVKVSVNIDGLTPGLHGLHVHEEGNFNGDCTAAGSHYNPYETNHGGRLDAVRHVGDLGNVLASVAGNVDTTFVDSRITLFPGVPHYIVGRAVVAHEREDDLGLGGDAGSLSTGNAGGRAGCGKIEVVECA